MNMNGGKRSLRSAAALLLAAVLAAANVPFYANALTGALYEEDFESSGVGERPAYFTYGEAGGSISVAEANGSKYLAFQHETDGAYTYLSYEINGAADTNYTFSFDYMQNDVSSTENVLLELNGADGAAIRICARGNELLYDTSADGADSIVLLSSYSPNLWYSFTVSVNAESQQASVMINGAAAGEELPFINEAASILEMRVYTMYSPGFMLDNLACYTDRRVESVGLSGVQSITVPQSGFRQYEYYACAYDQRGNQMAGQDFSFDVSPASLTGIDYSVTDNKLTLTVDSSAAEADFSISVEVAGTTASDSMNISVRNAVLSKAVIIGSDRVTLKDSKQSVFSYTCKLYDTNGDEMSGGIDFYAEGSLPEGVFFDPAAGTLTVTKAQTNGAYIKLRAVSTENPDIYAVKTVAALDLYTYRTDEERMNSVLSYVEKMLDKASDQYQGTPLLANGVNVDTDEPVSYRVSKDQYHPNETIVPSDIAEQYNFMRVLYALSDITGNPYYKERAKAIYQYYIDEHLYSDNGLFYVGGHCCIDLLTTNINYAVSYPDIHEYKDHFGFYEPFFEIDPDITEKYLKAVFAGHFYDTSKLFFNRHAKFSKNMDADQIYYDLGAYDDNSDALVIDCTGLTFRNAGNDLIYSLLCLYEHTGENEALTWARRVLDKYIAAQNPDTNISVQQYNTGYGDPNCLTAPDNWWLRDDYMTYTVSNYGDRLNNQFADDWIAKGLYDESERGLIIEPNYLSDPSMAYGSANLVDLKMAELLGMDTAEGHHYAENSLKTIAGYIKYAYNAESNVFEQIMTDGTVITGMMAPKTGYYGRKGSVLSSTGVGSEFFVAAVKVYDACRNFDGLDEEKSIVWSFINNYAKSIGLGDFGENESEIVVDLTTDSSDSYVILALVDLYKTTGNYDVLNLARAIGNNIVANRMVNGYFVASSSYLYSQLDDLTTYSLVLLDAATRGDFTTVPVSYMGKGLFHTGYKDARGRDMSAAFDFNFLWNTTRVSVYVTDIVTEQAEYTVKSGEACQLGVTIKPDDASTTTVNWYSDDPTVATVDDGVIYAYSPGETRIIGVSNDLRAKTEIRVVVEERTEEE